jgi:hypothetical protein
VKCVRKSQHFKKIVFSLSILFATTYSVRLRPSTGSAIVKTGLTTGSWKFTDITPALYAITVQGLDTAATIAFSASDSNISFKTFDYRTTRAVTDCYSSLSSVAYEASTGLLCVGTRLLVSTDGGSSWTKKTTANGLSHNYVLGVAVSGSTIYAATDWGLSIPQ